MTKLIPYEFKNMKIISGGQSGADQGGLEGALKAGFDTGGFIPKGFKTENGPMKELGPKFHLLETSTTDYVYRTHLNAKTSDMTLWFGTGDSAGFKATLNGCKIYKKLFVDVSNMTDDEIINLIKEKKPRVLNIAGHRESKAIGIQEKVRNTIYNVLNKLK
jgi:hypothetical protein